MPIPTNPQFPLVHTNGTSAEELLEQQCDVAGALRNALAVMVARGPNARDYYPLDADAFTRARHQHYDRCAKVSSVLAEVDRLAEYLASDPHEQLSMRQGVPRA